METQTATPRTRSGLTPLCELAEKYGTDKLGYYTPIYDLILSGRRDSVSKVLEVGIGTPATMQHVKDYQAGASLRMWRDYFPNAKIYGLDVNKSACEAADKAADLDRITLWCGDSREADPVAYAGAVGLFDLILDDGNHQPETQLATFKSLSPLLVPGGLYIIEDAEFFSEVAAGLPEHTLIRHDTKHGVGVAILIRQEALNG